MPLPPESFAPPTMQKAKNWNERIKPDGRLSQCVTRFNQDIRKNNHGISEQNILAMLLPVGFDASKLDAVWLIEMNDLASLRGQTAHLSSSVHLSQPILPGTELQRMRKILSGLRPVDHHLSELLNQAR